VPRRCFGEHKLFAPIRPIALTLCDVYSLARQNKPLALGLAAAAVALLLYAHLTAAQLESHTFDLVYSAIKAYLSKKATGIVYQGILHWALSNGAFFVFRFCAYLVVYAAYDLGRNVVFSLSLLMGITLITGLTLGQYLFGGGAWSGHIAGWALLFAAFSGWFWFRYMSTGNDQHRSFDFDVGEALVRLRRF
jgi:hypothetical protein